MCGRYSMTADADDLRDELGVTEVPADMAPRYNIAPSQPVPVLTNREPSRVRMHHFGLVPHWADDPSIGHRMINARRESLAERAAFRDAYRRHRCLVLADGFYEWQRIDGGKQPYYVRMRSKRPFGFAGLWAVWHGPDGRALPSCTIVTAPALGDLEPIHDRMPVIVPRELRGAWLDPDPEDPVTLAPMLDATPVGDLEVYPVSSYVNAPANEGPECIAPLP